MIQMEMTRYPENFKVVALLLRKETGGYASGVIASSSAALFAAIPAKHWVFHPFNSLHAAMRLLPCDCASVAHFDPHPHSYFVGTFGDRHAISGGLRVTRRGGAAHRGWPPGSLQACWTKALALA